VHVITDKANSRKYDVTRYRWYIKGPAKIRNPHISVNILRLQVKVQLAIYAGSG